MSKFREGINTVVFTTKYVINDILAILNSNVFHYEDSSWQFSGNEIYLQGSDYKVISFEGALSIDKTIEELGDMLTKFSAIRYSVKRKWKILPLND